MNAYMDRRQAADLDRHITGNYGEDFIDTVPITVKCNGNCNQGRACSCGQFPMPESYDVETSSPWMALLYAAAIVAAIAVSCLYPWGFAQ
jgi:hypothetical protein